MSLSLTPRMLDVSDRLCAGASVRDIAKATGLSIATVQTYMKRIYERSGVHSRAEFMAQQHALRLAELNEKNAELVRQVEALRTARAS